MPRRAAAAEAPLDSVVRDAMEGVVRRASVVIARAVAELAAAHLSEQLEASVARAGRKRPRRAAPARVRADITRWAADRRARRVPNFVIETTGLKTKKAIVQKYGENVVFEKGKPSPKPR